MTPRQIAARNYARKRYANPSGDDIEVDDTPAFSAGDEGIWVQAWVWVPFDACPEAAPEGWTP